jgi:small basic protein (TIGR04137 family)
MVHRQLYIRSFPQSETTLIQFQEMSQHNSLKASGGIVVKRNVLKRFERVDLMKKRGQWKSGDRVMGLRKTKPDV